MSIFVIRRHGARPHSAVHLETRSKCGTPRPEREFDNCNGPVIVKARDGKILPKPEVIPVIDWKRAS